MTISGVSSTSPSFAQELSNDQNSFRQLTSAIQNGDLSTAQSAYTSLTQGDPSLLTSSPLGQDLSAIGQALQSGDASAAQTALSQLQTDAQKLGGAHHHHHHGHRAGGAQSSSQSPAGTDSATKTTNPTTQAPGTTATSGIATVDGSTFTITV